MATGPASRLLHSAVCGLPRGALVHCTSPLDHGDDTPSGYAHTKPISAAALVSARARGQGDFGEIPGGRPASPGGANSSRVLLSPLKRRNPCSMSPATSGLPDIGMHLIDWRSQKRTAASAALSYVLYMTLRTVAQCSVYAADVGLPSVPGSDDCTGMAARLVTSGNRARENIVQLSGPPSRSASTSQRVPGSVVAPLFALCAIKAERRACGPHRSSGHRCSTLRH